MAFLTVVLNWTEVYIHPFPGPGAKLIVSTDGGSFPVWSQDGKELFYRSGNKLMMVPIQLGHDLVVGQPEMLFSGPFYQRAPGVMPDGRQFVMIREEPLTHVNIVLNWFEELKRLVPVN